MRTAGQRLAVLSGVVVMAAIMGATSASAKGLGGVTSAQLSSLTMTASTGAPAVVAWDNFNGTNGTNLNGTTTDGGGKTWSVNVAGGSWTIQGNAARSSSSDTSLVIDGGSSSRTITGTIFRNGATTFDAGFTINRNSAGTQFLTAEWTSTSNGSLELWKYNNGWSLLMSVTNLYPSGIGTAPASIVLSLASTTGNVLRAAINGTPVVSTTLSAADQSTYKNATHQLVGPYQYTVNGLTIDDVHVDNP
jgi:hypothetical protein